MFFLEEEDGPHLAAVAVMVEQKVTLRIIYLVSIFQCVAACIEAQMAPFAEHEVNSAGSLISSTCIVLCLRNKCYFSHLDKILEKFPIFVTNQRIMVALKRKCPLTPSGGWHMMENQFSS